MASIEERVESLIESTVNNLGYELYDVEYAKEGKDYFLRIFIDKEAGIDLNDCEKVNDGINDLLDQADYIKEQYFLEVSSPGIERVLRKDWQLKKYLGEEVEIRLFKKDEYGQKEYIAKLIEVTEEYLKIQNEEQELKIDRKNISLVKWGKI